MSYKKVCIYGTRDQEDNKRVCDYQPEGDNEGYLEIKNVRYAKISWKALQKQVKEANMTL